MTLQQSDLITAACRTKDLDPALVIDVLITDDDIFLQTEALGDIRVERSALPALRPAVAPKAPAAMPPEALLIPSVPSNTLAALVEAGYTTLTAIAEADDEALLAVDGVGEAMLKRIRSAIIDEATTL